MQPKSSNNSEKTPQNNALKQNKKNQHRKQGNLLNEWQGNWREPVKVDLWLKE